MFGHTANNSQQWTQTAPPIFVHYAALHFTQKWAPPFGPLWLALTELRAMEKIIEFLNLLKALQANIVTLDEIEIFFRKIDNFHNFWHYISDEDIRAKDSEYAKMQSIELTKFISALEAGDYNKAKNITFVDYSA